jgi:hypothetical protein
MTHPNKTQPGNSSTPKRVFVSHAHVLPEEKRGVLSQKEKDFEKSCQERGVWLELFCPDDACLTETERFSVPVFCADPKVKKSVFLDLLCPDDSCDVVEATRLP